MLCQFLCIKLFSVSNMSGKNQEFFYSLVAFILFNILSWFKGQVSAKEGGNPPRNGKWDPPLSKPI